MRIATLLLTAASAVLTGCVPASHHAERMHVSKELRERTGHVLRANAEAASIELPPGVTLTVPITEDAAVAIALWNNPVLQENLSQLGLARADLAQAGLLTNPNFSVLFPIGPKQLEFAATFPIEAVWLRPRRVAIARLDAERVAEGLVLNGLNLVRDVRVGLSDLALAHDHSRLAREAHAKYQRAEEALHHWNTQLASPLEELVRRSEKAFELGELSPLAVQEYSLQLLGARVRQGELVAELRRARAELERSVGTRLPAGSN